MHRNAAARFSWTGFPTLLLLLLLCAVTVRFGAAGAESSALAAGDEASCDSAAGAPAPRYLHYGIRARRLKASLQFLEHVLGMHTLRHDEDAEGSQITSNGRETAGADKPWSKTVMGYRPVDEGFSFEVTFNYGVKKYKPGSGLQGFVIALPQAKIHDAIVNAQGLHHEVRHTIVRYPRARGGRSNKIVIDGPDGYTYQLVPLEPLEASMKELGGAGGGESAAATAAEQFALVHLAVKSVKAAKLFYTDVLGMRDLASELPDGLQAALRELRQPEAPPGGAGKTKQCSCLRSTAGACVSLAAPGTLSSAQTI
eukprot:SAG22_NODE_1434_length_4427_cov_2.505776_1_plen_312_part_00